MKVRKEQKEAVSVFMYQFYDHFSERQWIQSNPGMTLYFPVIYMKCIGRLPLCLMKPLFGIGEESISLSNLPWTSEQGEISGSRVSDIMVFSCIPKPQGLGTVIVGYNGQARVSMLGIQECMTGTEMETFLDDYVNELETMGKEVHNNGYKCMEYSKPLSV